MPWWWTLCINLSASAVLCESNAVTSRVDVKLSVDDVGSKLLQCLNRVHTKLIQSNTGRQWEVEVFINGHDILSVILSKHQVFVLFLLIVLVEWRRIQSTKDGQRWYLKSSQSNIGTEIVTRYILYSVQCLNGSLLSLFKCYRIWNIVLVTHKR